jgi:hypothetical protein
MKNMERLVSLILVLCTLSNLSFADCDWSTIKKNVDGSYIYSSTLNLCVGNMVQDNKVKTKQIDDYIKAITMKDLMIQESDKKAQVWSDTSAKLEDRLQKVDSLEKKNDWLWFGLGILVTGAAVFGASKLR